MNQTIFAIGILPPANQFGTPVFATGPITIVIGGIASTETFGFDNSVGNISVTGFAIPSAEHVSGRVRVSALSRYPAVTSQLQEQFPSFISEDHENFLLFMEAYYEWLESYGQVIYETKNLLNNQDIDTTVDRFVEFFQKEFLVNLPRQMITDKSLVLKNIKDYYRARGTEKSYEFFFRIMFGEEASFYYPRIDILKVSDGKWIQPKTLRVSTISGDPFELIGRKIRGLTNNSSAFVENVSFVQEGFIAVYELYLNRSSITGQFEPEETIKTTDGSNISCKITPLPLEVVITDGGAGYEEGQIVEILGVGSGAKAKIIAVDDAGAVTKVQMVNYGAGYFGSVTPHFPLYSGVTQQAFGTITVGALTNYPGYYLNEDGQLSTTKFLQDGFFYQQFSYVVQVNESVNLYRDALKKALHPAGLIFFGTVLSQNEVDGSMSVPLNFDRTTNSTLIRHIEDLIQFNTKVYDELTLIHWLKEAEDSFKLGPSYRSIERDKFRYKPFEAYDANQDMAGGANAGYWSSPIHPYANYQIKDFKNIIIKDMTEKPYTKINTMPEPVLRTSDLTGVPSGENFGLPSIVQS